MDFRIFITLQEYPIFELPLELFSFSFSLDGFLHFWELWDGGSSSRTSVGFSLYRQWLVHRDAYLRNHHLIGGLQIFLLEFHFLLVQFELIFNHLSNLRFLISCEEVVLPVVGLVAIGDVLVVEVDEVHVVVAFCHLVDEEEVV